MSDIVSARPADIRLFGFIAILLGILAILAPVITGLSITLIVGALVLAGGVFRMLWAWRMDSLRNRSLSFAIGLMTLICGVILVSDPLVASGVLTILLAAYFVLDGLSEMATAFSLRPAAGWGWLLLGGALSLLLGMMIWVQFPLSGAWAIGILLGIKLILVGVIMLSVEPGKA
jgi:uncharacterized membrane protein HdeD (DUF308 family)